MDEAEDRLEVGVEAVVVHVHLFENGLHDHVSRQPPGLHQHAGLQVGGHNAAGDEVVEGGAPRAVDETNVGCRNTYRRRWDLGDIVNDLEFGLSTASGLACAFAFVPVEISVGLEVFITSQPADLKAC